MPKRSITLTDTHYEWLTNQVASGQYRSESEVISDLIREQQQRDHPVRVHLQSYKPCSQKKRQWDHFMNW